MKTYTYTNAEHTGIRVEDTETGAVLFVPTDPANRDYAEILASNVEIAAYVAPPPPVPQSITMRQLLIGLQADAWITPPEAVAWAARTALPANVQAVIDAMPEAERPAARITAFTTSAAYRDDSMLLAAAQAAMPDATPDEIAAALDDAFRRWSLL